MWRCVGGISAIIATSGRCRPGRRSMYCASQNPTRPVDARRIQTCERRYIDIMGIAMCVSPIGCHRGDTGPSLLHPYRLRPVRAGK